MQLPAEVKPTEKELVALIRAEKPVPGVDAKFVAAVRRIDEVRGQIEFSPEGDLVGVDLSAERISVADADVELLTSMGHLRRLRLNGGEITKASVRGCAR